MRPLITLEPRCHFQCLTNRALDPHPAAKVVFEGIEVDGFHRLGVLMRAILASPPLSLAHFDPMGFHTAMMDGMALKVQHYFMGKGQG